LEAIKKRIGRHKSAPMCKTPSSNLHTIENYQEGSIGWGCHYLSIPIGITSCHYVMPTPLQFWEQIQKGLERVEQSSMLAMYVNSAGEKVTGNASARSHTETAPAPFASCSRTMQTSMLSVVSSQNSKLASKEKVNANVNQILVHPAKDGWGTRSTLTCSLIIDPISTFLTDTLMKQSD
jgi:hypothetical protein